VSLSLLDLILGRPLASSEDRKEKIGALQGVPIFGLDALGSAAYGPEAALTVLLALGGLGLNYILPITLAIIALLGVVYFSYRQTIPAYPHGGGSYTVASENLGTFPGLLAASALMIDYILVVAVGISAGVGALVSGVPSLQPHTLGLCLAILLVIALVNLRGLRDTGLAFLVPTYAFIGTMLAVLAWGLFKAVAGSGHPIPVVAPPHFGPVHEAVAAWLLLKAFSSGCTAMTGVEAVSNGVAIFRAPADKNAQGTLTIIIGLLMVMLAGIAYLCHAYQIGATPPGQPGYESVLSQLTAAIAGRGIFYYVTMASILLVLSFQANTAFSGFPRLCHSIARNSYLPHSFARRGRRLVFSQGIALLTLLAAGLLVLFGGVTDRLIPLFAIGAFLAFTLSQAGMVAHWKRKSGRHARYSMIVNGLGAIATAITTLVVVVSKFAEGAWITLLVIPALIATMYKVKQHYDELEAETTKRTPLSTQKLAPPLVVVPVGGWSQIAHRNLRFAMMMSTDIIAVHVDNGEGRENLSALWKEFVEEPARRAGLPVPQLTILKSPYRFIIAPILRFVLELERTHPDRFIAVVVPELVEKHWYQYFLHEQRGKILSLLLIFRGNQRISIINVPWHLDATPTSEKISRELKAVTEEKQNAA